MQIKLPSFTRIIYTLPGSKNVIKQLIVPSVSISFDTREEGRNYLIVTDANKKYYFTNQSENYPPEYEYVIQTDFVPKITRFESATIKIKKWLKHPAMNNYTPVDVLASWKNKFFYTEEDQENNINGLRQPQIAALHMILGHLNLPIDTATVIMPTGTGKTETMLSALVAFRCEKLLITVPSDSLRDQLSNKFLTLGLLKAFNVISQDCLYPIVGIIKNKFGTPEELRAFIEQCNVVVSTMSWLTAQNTEDQQLISDACSQIFIDESHHVKASTWHEFKSKFSKEKVIQFTATPFRNDGKRLDGKIISDFPLRKAQEQGYYKNIEFIAIREYDLNKADKKIADAAVKRLREDNKTYNHILMARCANKNRADEIFKLYEKHTDLNPVLLYSNVANFKESYEKILNKQTNIIVCVDMLGEGFDLPELKIAAFHDIRKSLPITLQFAGRFTRTKYDEQLGDASFVANIADLDVKNELADLYASDANWNKILSDSSSERIEEQVEFKDFISGFSRLSDSDIPFQNIKTKMSTVVYKNKTTEWFPTNFKEGIPGYDNLEFKFHDLNRDKKELVIITGRRLDVEWVHDKKIYDIKWDITIVFWETKNNLLFINSSELGSVYQDLAKSIIGNDAELIKGIDVFKTFYNIKRIKLQNVGLRQFLGKNIRFRMMIGSDIAEALSLAEQQRGEKAFVMGGGYEEGNPVNIGASYKGRIWTKKSGNLKELTEWCDGIGKKLVNTSIDPNQILKETLIPKLLTSLPASYPIWIDWDVDMYADLETKFKFIIDGITYDLSTIELTLDDDPIDSGNLVFNLRSETLTCKFTLQLFEETPTEGEPFPNYKIEQVTSQNVRVRFGNKEYLGKDFFEAFLPTIWFADGSALTGNEYFELKQSIGLYPKEKIIAWDWTGVNLRVESQGVQNKKTDSIQYKVIQELIKEDYDVVYDDDYAGEIADVVAIKLTDEKIVIKLYHLKFAADGVVSNQIKNLYEVCGQAQKSIHWRHKSGKEFIDHLLRRETKTRNDEECSRLEKGTKADLLRLSSILKNEIPVEHEIFLVQPSISKQNASDDILTLLNVTSSYIKEVADVNLHVIGSA